MSLQPSSRAPRPVPYGIAAYREGLIRVGLAVPRWREPLNHA